MTLFGSAYNGKRVLVTGHTGFKGAWLCQWLLGLGAEVTGLSLPPPTEPALFNVLGLARRLHHILGDIQEPEVLRQAVKEAKPDFVFHLAAQALVRESYRIPRETFSINAMGTLHMLEALRDVSQNMIQPLGQTQHIEERRFGGRRQAQAGHFRTQAQQPFAQPRALESRVAGEQHPTATPELRV